MDTSKARLLAHNDGPKLEALKRLNGETIHLSSRAKDRPDRDRLGYVVVLCGDRRQS
jgi:hypothetical protein